jgi:hypothetical protein
MPITHLILLSALALTEVAAPRRVVSGRTITSDRLPAISLGVAKGLDYVGVFPFTIRDVAAGERHVWVDADASKRVKRLFILQFEGFNEGTGQTYKYTPRNVTKLGAHDYNSNGFFYDDVEYGKERPGNEAELTRRFLESRGYTLAREQVLYRFYRSLPEDGHKSEFLIFYIEPMANLSIALRDVSENQDSEREKGLLDATRKRALAAFAITRG